MGNAELLRDGQAGRVTYSVKEIFATVQGEGGHAGVPAIFVRFTGCNMWSGTDATRERDAERNGAACPRYCDTDFRAAGATTFNSSDGVAGAVAGCAAVAEMPSVPLIVITGGEPTLQLDEPLLLAIRHRFPRSADWPLLGTQIAIETNGSREIPDAIAAHLDWICVSPKQSPDAIRQRHGDELKLPYPDVLAEPEDYAVGTRFAQYVLTPVALPTAVGSSLVSAENARAAVAYAQRHPRWRVSLQSHKHMGVA